MDLEYVLRGVRSSGCEPRAAARSDEVDWRVDASVLCSLQVPGLPHLPEVTMQEQPPSEGERCVQAMLACVRACVDEAVPKEV